MKIPAKFLAMLLLLTTPCLANNRKSADDGAPKLLVLSINRGTHSKAGTIAILGGTPFAVDSNTTIVIDGAPATLAQVKAGMQVLSQSAPGTTFGEIDLKTIAATKKKR